MKIALYHPDMDFRGGGEYVACSVIETLKDHDVTVFVSKDIDLTSIGRFFGLDTSSPDIRIIPHWIRFLPKTIRPYARIRWMHNNIRGYDLVIDTASNGLFFEPMNTKTLCYVHFPFFFSKKHGWKSFMNRWVLKPDECFRYDTVLCNSRFTRDHLASMGVDAQVLYPPVDVDIPEAKKLDRIVTVGRFSREKKHEVMIKAYKKAGFSWPLHIIGTFNDASIYDKRYLDELKRAARESDIFFHFNMDHGDVLEFLASSKIYWHARGYGEDDPHAFENFGITTVEAMAAGCIPIVINKGAQPEIVRDKKDGFVWGSVEDLIRLTQRVIEKGAASIKPKKRAQDFSKTNFFKGLKEHIR